MPPCDFAYPNHTGKQQQKKTKRRQHEKFINCQEFLLNPAAAAAGGQHAVLVISKQVDHGLMEQLTAAAIIIIKPYLCARRVVTMWANFRLLTTV